MSDVNIKTANRHYPLLDWSELTPKEQADFDWIEDPERNGPEFFRYKGRVYNLSEFMRLEHTGEEFKGWHGYRGDSYFSGTLIKLGDTGESVIPARYYS